MVGVIEGWGARVFPFSIQAHIFPVYNGESILRPDTVGGRNRTVCRVSPSQTARDHLQEVLARFEQVS